MSNTKKRTRMIHYDLLRIVAAFSVVMLHSAAQFWYTLDIRSTEWIITNSYNSVFRFGVPIFVMISGAMFLDKNYVVDIKRLYKHNVFRMVVLYAVWSCIYGVYDCRNFDFSALGIKEIIRELLYGRYHLWFIPMIVGIYMLLPVLKSWVEHTDKKNIEYFLLLFLVWKIGGETARALIVTDEIHYVLDLVKLEMACSYVGYFVLGYYLAHIGICAKLRKLLYVLVIPSALANIVLGNLLSWRAGEPAGDIFDSFGIFTFIIVTALFLFTLEKGRKAAFTEKRSSIIKELSADTLGVYLIHILLIEALELCGIHSMMLPIGIGVPVLAILIFVLSLVIAAGLRRIPVVGKFLC